MDSEEDYCSFYDLIVFFSLFLLGDVIFSFMLS